MVWLIIDLAQYCYVSLVVWLEDCGHLSLVLRTILVDSIGSLLTHYATNTIVSTGIAPYMH